MPFADFDDFTDASLKLPVAGKTYVTPSPDAKTGLLCQRLVAGTTTLALGGEMSDAETQQILSDNDERELYERILGPAWDEMLADGVPWHVLQLAGTTALIWIVNGEAAAEECWNLRGHTPKAEPKPPADRKASAKSARQGSPGSTGRIQPKTTSRAGRKSSTTGSS